jgi:hypothetical protein
MIVAIIHDRIQDIKIGSESRESSLLSIQHLGLLSSNMTPFMVGLAIPYHSSLIELNNPVELHIACK